MKYSVSILFLLIITACSKDALKSNSDLNGTWELTSSYGGWVGQQTYPSGNGNIFTFNGNTYSRAIKGYDTTYKYSGTYKIYTGKPCDIAEEQTVIKFDDDETASTFPMSADEFTIGTGNCIADGGSQTYKKVQ